MAEPSKRRPDNQYSDFDTGDNDGYEMPVSRASAYSSQQRASSPRQLPKIPTMDETSSNIYDSIRPGKFRDPGIINRIKVSGFSSKCTKDFLENFFESKKIFGKTLDVENVDLHQRAGFAVVTFKDPQDVITVLEVHSRKPCSEHGYELTIELYSEEVVQDQDETRSIEVRGFSPNSGNDTIRFYFENFRKSGGGPTESFTMNDDRTKVIITFEENGVVERVIEKEHTIDKCQLTVKKFVVSKTEILLVNISPKASSDSIIHYCEAKFKLNEDVESVVFSEDGSKVLVSFRENIDFKKIEDACNRFPLLEYHMTPEPVPVTDGIIVTNISEESTRDTFRYYFENQQRSSGGDVYDVQLLEGTGYCLVFFKDPNVVQSVCSQNEHFLGENLLKVEPYNACLGLPAGGQHGQFTFPEPILVDSLSAPKQQFLEKNDKHREAFNRKMASNHAVVQWNSPFPVVECAITSSVRDYKKLVRSWAQKVRQVIDGFDAACDVKEFRFESEELEDIVKGLNELNIHEPDNVAVKINSKENKISLVALKECMADLRPQIEHAIDKAKEECKKKKEMKTETKQFKPWNIKYLKAVHFADRIKQKYQIDFDYKEDTAEVILMGPKTVISEILLDIYDVLEKVREKKLTMDKGQIGLLSQDATADKINRELRDKGLGEVWEVGDTCIALFADDHNDLRKMENVMENMLTKISVDLEENKKDLLQSKDWKDLESRLHREFAGCIVIETSGKMLVVYTIAEHEDNIDKKVKAFFSKNTLYKEGITMDANIVKFIKKYMLRDIDVEINNSGQKGKKLKYELSKNKVSIEGTSKDIKLVKEIFKKFEGEVICKSHTLKQRGIYLYISSNKGQDSIRNVETSASCIIEVMGKGLGSSLGKGRKEQASKKFDKALHCAEATLRSGQKVIIFGGDMTTLDVDMIVNASNRNMQHVGGLAAVILRKGGSDIQNECEDHVQQHGTLHAGEVFVSGPGDLKCAAIAHAVGPVWHDGKQGEKDDLEMAVENCLKATDGRKFASIAIPALSAGMFGYPMDKACLVIADTIKTYFENKSSSSIKEVFLCDISIKTVQSFVEAAKSTFKDCQILADLGKDGDKDRRQAWLLESGAFQDGDATFQSPFGNTVVKIVKGELNKERADVIVNSASPDLQLEKGKSSEALLKAGGSKIQDECNNRYPNGIQTGEVAVTTGGKLHCKQVFHIALEPYKKHKTMHPIQYSFPSLVETITKYERPKGLKKSMMECLTQAEKKGYTSISFPAMGTGAQGYPKDKVATEMFGVMASYCKRNPNTSLSTVHFVVFHQDDTTFEAFVTEENKLLGENDSAPSVDTSGLGKVIKIKRDYGEFEFGSIQIKIFQGDITDQDTDAIVASCNRDLDLSKGAVTKAIVRKGGREIEKDCAKQKSEMQKKGITVTTAGQLHSKYIIHVDTKYNLSEWEGVMLKCLEVAEKHKFGSLSFPALGTSVGCRPGAIAGLLSSALASFHQQSPRHVKEVCVVIFQTEMLGPFIDGMKSALTGSGASNQRPSSTRERPRSSRSSHHGSQSKSPNMDDLCSLTIYGRLNSRIDKAIQQLKAHIESNWIKKTIKESAIPNLHKSKIKEIQESGQSNSVLVDIDNAGGVVTLTGHPVNIITVTDKVNRVIQAFDRSVHEKKMAKMVTNMIKWFYVKDNKSYPFPDRENLRIETAFSNKEKTVRIKDHSGGEYEINLNDMTEWDVKRPNVKFPVIRKDLVKEVGHETPKHWTIMKQGQQVMLITLKTSDKEYQDVSQHFTSSLGRPPNIKKIERVQNVTLYTQYMAKKRQMESSNPKIKNERMLWHGTDVNAVDSINNHGFNRSYCGKNATALGAGVYFAVNSQYSDQGTYTPTDASGNKHMYRARVLTGEFTVGSSGLRVPPAKDQRTPHILFDSVVNNTTNPIMYVIFHDTQAYPEHIITYQ